MSNSETVYYRNDPVVVKCLIEDESLGFTKDKVYHGHIDIDEDVSVLCDKGYESMLFVGEYEVVEDGEQE